MREHRARCLRPPLRREDFGNATRRCAIVHIGHTFMWLWECLSRMRGNLHVRFLGEAAAVTLQPYPLIRLRI
ncbi:hypothetical protein LMG29542_07490 [Paraburkholderia humisilvae]|uniref:Uncharacterized protein n=1 Tax=Paraburkholderia humisilvae TaxID=627669 RepID=A0A6J5F9M7_9BURK|nr:hypothetical protein LMG29542_07490 [Paraburkholderia humisilvae]